MPPRRAATRRGGVATTRRGGVATTRRRDSLPKYHPPTSAASLRPEVSVRAGSVLRAKFGIVVRDEEAMPVGDKGVGETWSAWICPHVVGGIPPGVVHAEYPMTRDGPKYTGITGVTD